MPAPTYSAPAAPPTPRVQQNRWISTLSLVLGYVWLVSGLDKVLSGKFVPGFAQYISDLTQFAPQYPWVKDLLETIVLPNATLMAVAVQYGELIIGTIIIAASIQTFFRMNAILCYLLAFLHIIGFFLTLTIIFAQGASFPFIDVNKVFEPGVNLDFTLLGISFCLVLVNLKEATRSSL